ncbi:MAG: TlpA family protein disulfide reductase [Nocardioidaceae bacterium]
MTARRIGHNRRALHVVAVLLLTVVTVLASGCQSQGSDPASPTDTANTAAARGGAEQLPGPVPDGVRYRSVSRAAPHAPTFRATLLDGTPLRVQKLWAQRPVVLVFFSSWCARCAALQPRYNAVLGDFGDRIAVLGIAGSDSRKGVTRYLKEHRVDYAVALDDGRIWRSYAVREPPAVVLVGKGGHLLRGWPGGVRPKRLRQAIRHLIVSPDK